MCQVSKASVDQAAEIYALCKSSFAIYAGRIDPPSSMDRETVESYRNHILDDTCAIIQNDSDIMGCIFYKSDGVGFYFYKLAIGPNYRRQGLARKLLSHLEQEASFQGVPHITLNVRVELTENIKLFTSHGYIEKTRCAHAGYTQPTYIVMQKQL